MVQHIWHYWMYNLSDWRIGRVVSVNLSRWGCCESALKVVMRLLWICIEGRDAVVVNLLWRSWCVVVNLHWRSACAVVVNSQWRPSMQIHNNACGCCESLMKDLQILSRICTLGSVVNIRQQAGGVGGSGHCWHDADRFGAGGVGGSGGCWQHADGGRGGG